MIQILIDLADIPSGAHIRKLTGTTVYQVEQRIVVHSTAGKLTQVEAEAGAVFLLPTDGPSRNIHACSADKRVVWLNPEPDVLEQKLREEGLITDEYED